MRENARGSGRERDSAPRFDGQARRWRYGGYSLAVGRRQLADREIDRPHYANARSRILR